MIRTGKIEDSDALLELQRSVVSEEKYLIALREEFNKTPAEQREWVQNIMENKNETFFVAEIDGEVVGWIVFTATQNRKRLAHTGTFGMMIGEKYRGRGIGKLLLSALMDWAEKNPVIEKVSLGVFSTNERAIALYKKMGFIEEGRKIKEFKFDDDVYVDDILMYKLV
ncbi:GNAT family N-acetyltransferase [Falsibacillus albus]|uniref:GNAT family N-acetyltransferase n=1 Tax=Falsibacillus albus TaxID=2478915 RepID=A0A3L7JVG4_9BACI|nr:GNAT family N-acetyltransferase [Falsibacillus albus]